MVTRPFQPELWCCRWWYCLTSSPKLAVCVGLTCGFLQARVLWCCKQINPSWLGLDIDMAPTVLCMPGASQYTVTGSCYWISSTWTPCKLASTCQDQFCCYGAMRCWQTHFWLPGGKLARMVQTFGYQWSYFNRCEADFDWNCAYTLMCVRKRLIKFERDWVNWCNTYNLMNSVIY